MFSPEEHRDDVRLCGKLLKVSDLTGYLQRDHCQVIRQGIPKGTGLLKNSLKDIRRGQVSALQEKLSQAVLSELFIAGI